MRAIYSIRQNKDLQTFNLFWDYNSGIPVEAWVTSFGAAQEVVWRESLRLVVYYKITHNKSHHIHVYISAFYAIGQRSRHAWGIPFDAPSLWYLFRKQMSQIRNMSHKFLLDDVWLPHPYESALTKTLSFTTNKCIEIEQCMSYTPKNKAWCGWGCALYNAMRYHVIAPLKRSYIRLQNIA